MERILKTASVASLLATIIPMSANAVPSVIAQHQSSRFQSRPSKTEPQRRPAGGSQSFVQNCPEGQKIVMWKKPIYDEQGLFIVGHKEVPVCVPIDAKPAG